MKRIGPKPGESIAQWATLNYQVMVREMIPGPQMSDQARAIFEGKLAGIAGEIGPERFIALLDLVVDTCDRRPTIATLRELAGIPRPKPRPQYVSAWNVVTLVVRRHLRLDTESGTMVVVPYARMNAGVFVEEPAPEITASIQRAVDGLGGWSNLSSSYPEYWSAKLNMFKDLYEGEQA